MLTAFIYGILGVILLILVVLTYQFKPVEKLAEDAEDEDQKERISLTQGFLYAAIVLIIIITIAFTWYFLKGTPQESHLMEWLNIIVRIMHFTFGIAWIGASFYFVFLENALNRTHNVRDELAGNLWAVHGGGFYYLEKYKIAPKEIPKDLHWFKYESYFTWLSGFCLLFVVYYFNASAMLIDKNVLDITPITGILIGVGSFVAAYTIYDQLCKRVLPKSNTAFIIGFMLMAFGFAYLYTHVFSARAAFIHFGAMLGSIMSANVFFVIIPSQKAMVKAGKLGLPLDPTIGKKALARSIHNNYFTLPVLFVMVSNHFPSTFGYQTPWLVLLIISIGAAGVKHYLNLKEKGHLNVWILPVSIVVLLAAAFITAPKASTTECSTVAFARVNTIITERCTPCHSSRPTDDQYSAAPNGVMFDTPDQIAKMKEKIMQRVVITKTMPQNNKTNITPEERDLIRCWIEQGANTK